MGGRGFAHDRDHYGPPHWLLGFLGGRRRRAEHGEVRYLILDAVRDRARHGYEIIRLIESRTNGAYRPSPGTVYPTLQVLEDMGHVRSSESDGRRVYRATEEGLADLADHQDEVEEAYERLGGDLDPGELEGFAALSRRVRRLFRAVGRAYRKGGLDSRQIAEINRAIDDAVDRIEQVARGAPRDDHPE